MVSEGHTFSTDSRSWKVETLIRKSSRLPRFWAKVSDLRNQMDNNVWFLDPPTPLEILEHMDRIQKANLKFPIILNSDGIVMDGIHRICKASLLGKIKIRAVQFETDPEPDFLIDN